MADRHPRPTRRSETDDIVATAFAAYRAGAPDEFSPRASATALIAKAQRPPRRRALAVSVAGLAFAGLMFATVAVSQTVTSPSTDDLEAVGSDDSTDPLSQNQSTPSQGPSDGSPGSDSSPEPVEAELKRMTVSLPAWPGELGEKCPAGEFLFSPDDATGDSPHSPQSNPGDGPGVIGDWVLLPEGTHAKSTNLDGRDGDEVIVPVACGDVPGVIALTQEDGAFTSVAFVHAEQKPAEPIFVESVSDSVVTLSIPERSPDRVTLRTFAFDGEEFNETTDPDLPLPTSPGDGDESESPSEDDDQSSEPDSDDSQSPQPDGGSTDGNGPTH